MFEEFPLPMSPLQRGNMADSKSPLNIEAMLEHSSWMRSFARSLVFDQSKVDDVVQETWLAAIKTPTNRIQNPKAWLSGVVRHTVFDFGKAESRRAKREQLAAKEEALPSTADLAEQVSVQRKIAGLVLELEEPYRSTVLLRFFEDLTPNEIAERQGVPPATVYSRLSRALEQLREKLDRNYGDRRSWCIALLPLAKLAQFEALSGKMLWRRRLQNIHSWKLAGVAALFLFLLSYFLFHEDFSDSIKASGKIAKLPSENTAERKAANQDQKTDSSARNAFSSTAADSQVATNQNSVTVNGRILDVFGNPIPATKLGWLDPKQREAFVLRESVSEGTKRKQRGETNLRGLLDRQKQPIPHWATLIMGKGTNDISSAVQTDSAGRFTVELPQSRGGLCSADPRFVLVGGEWITEIASGELVIVFAPMREVEGIVHDANGEPLPDATIEANVYLRALKEFPLILDRWTTGWDRNVAGLSKTDSRGHFLLPGFPDIEESTIAISAVGFQKKVISLSAFLAEAGQISLEPLAEKSARLEGMVVDASGQPVSEALVGFAYQSAKTDSQGNFSLKVDSWNDNSKLFVIQDGFQAKIYEQFGKVFSENVRVKTGLVLSLGEPALFISGKIFGPDGNPISKCGFRVNDPTYLDLENSKLPMEEMFSDRTERQVATVDGEFQLHGLANRSYQIFVSHPKKPIAFVSDPIPAGSTGVEIHIPREVLLDRVAGQVVTKDGNPVPGVSVGCRLYYQGKNSRMKYRPHDQLAITDAEGRFELHDVLRWNSQLWFDGRDIFGQGVDLQGDDSNEDLKIVISKRCRFRVQLSEGIQADSFMVLSGCDSEMEFDQYESGVMVSRRTRSAIVRGSSSPCDLRDSAKTLVLFQGDREVQRVPLRLEPGKLIVVKI